ncbi:MAG: glycosyltransferase family 29 protein [Exiguobacterium sp.]|nr:glycosyltransferase family 29 protein [Exiguobacterium sp.]
MTMTVVYVCDEAYAPMLKASMASVRRYNRDAEFAVITDKPMTVDGAEVFVIEPNREAFKFRRHDRMRDGVFFKFYLARLPFDKALYIDCDVLCQRPLDDLWQQPCEFICVTESHAYGKKQAEALGLERYALTGMMLCNLKAMREARFEERCFARLASEKPRFHDETIINEEFGDKLRFLPVAFNYCHAREYESPIDERDAYLLHFVGKDKDDFWAFSGDFAELDALKPLLKRKRVAVVGNAASLLNKGQAKEIDEHDIVIRFNRGFPSDKVGRRTDILFLACDLTHQEIARYGHPKTIRRSRFCHTRCDYNLRTTTRARLSQEPNAAMRKRNPKLRSQASTGFLAVDFCLSAQCASVDLYGFDFFESPTYYNAPGYETLHNGVKEGERLKEFERCGLINIH